MRYGEQRAINEIKHILKSQWKNGMLPQIRFTEGQEGYSPDSKEWGVTREISGNPEVDTSGITQPPNVAIAAWMVYEDSESRTESIQFLEGIYPSLKRYHDFLLTKRDPEGDHLAAVFHPWATGTDNAPCYDELIEETRKTLAEKGFEQRIKNRTDINEVIKEYRPGERDYECYGRLIGLFVHHEYDQNIIYKECPFVVKDVMFNSILKESISSMAHIARALAEHYKDDQDKSSFYLSESESNKRTAQEMTQAIRTKLYDDETGLFFNYDVRTESLIKIPTIHSLTPLFGRIADEKQAQRLIQHIKDKKTFNPEFQIPTAPIDSDKFENIRYWRGPVWPATNWLMIRGIENYDKELANEIRLKTIGLIKEGFDQDIDTLAASLMEYTSFGEEFTTPSKTQYCHGWLWDSGFVAIGWRHVHEKTSPEIWERVHARKRELIEDGMDLRQIRTELNKEFKIPLFDEYYSSTNKDYPAGYPLGAVMMTWTAALLLDLIKDYQT